MPAFIEGQPVLVVIDIQGGDNDDSGDSGIPYMGDRDRLLDNAEKLVGAARQNGIPLVFIQEVHRPDHVDFGRELDGSEDVHCVDGVPSTAIHHRVRPQEGEYHIVKRRYSAFFGTDLEILLRGLKADTLILCGELTDVCVHYTFVDGHQHDYYMRVVEDCVGGSTYARHEASLDAMEYLQTGARCSTADVIAAFDRLKKAA